MSHSVLNLRGCVRDYEVHNKIKKYSKKNPNACIHAYCLICNITLTLISGKTTPKLF